MGSNDDVKSSSDEGTFDVSPFITPQIKSSYASPNKNTVEQRKLDTIYEEMEQRSKRAGGIVNNKKFNKNYLKSIEDPTKTATPGIGQMYGNKLPSI